MPKPVRCDVCGKLFSSRHLSSHKRLAHAKDKLAGAAGQDGMKTILELYKTLSEENGAVSPRDFSCPPPSPSSAARPQNAASRRETPAPSPDSRARTPQ